MVLIKFLEIMSDRGVSQAEVLQAHPFKLDKGSHLPILFYRPSPAVNPKFLKVWKTVDQGLQMFRRQDRGERHKAKWVAHWNRRATSINGCLRIVDSPPMITSLLTFNVKSGDVATICVNKEI